MAKLILSKLTSQILSLAFTVHNNLGCGLLESCYHGAMVVELQQAGIPYQSEQEFPLIYKGVTVGCYVADIVVAGTVILELKSVQAFNPVMFAQIINYLRLSGCQLGYLINFNHTAVQWRRFVCEKV
jgi:GxxExxY protein